MFSILNDSKILEGLDTHTQENLFIMITLITEQKHISIFLFAYNSNITGMPLHNAVHVQKGYVVNNLVDS